MKYYDSIPRIQDDGTLKGEMVWGFNKLDGQNFCARFSTKKNDWAGFASRHVTVDENSDSELAGAVKYFKIHYADDIKKIIKDNWKKGDPFQGIEDISFYFEWWGPNSFAGKHDFGDYINGKVELYLIDIFLKKKGYMEPKTYYELFKDTNIKMPELIYTGPLTAEIIEKVQNNDWTSENPEFPTVKEGVVFKRSTMMKGQRRPSVKVKTNWWLNKLHSTYPEDMWKTLE